MRSAMGARVSLTQVVLRLLDGLDLEGALDGDGEVDLGLVEAAEVELVDDAALLVVVDGVAADELGRDQLGGGGRRVAAAAAEGRGVFGRLGGGGLKEVGLVAVVRLREVVVAENLLG